VQQTMCFIESGSIQPEHVHPLVSAPPHLSVSKFMQLVKRRTGRKPLQEFERLNRQFWGRSLWARGCFAASTGNVTEEIVKQYIDSKGKEPPEEIDNFGASKLWANFIRFSSYRLKPVVVEFDEGIEDIRE